MALVKNLPQEMQVQSMDLEEGKKETATHSSIFAWEIPPRSLAGYAPWDRKESDTTEWHSHSHNRFPHAAGPQINHTLR